MEILVQISTSLILLLGVFLGELITYKSWGRPKDWAIFLDIVAFVVILVSVFNFISFSAYNLQYYAVVFLLGSASITAVRSLEHLAGLTEHDPERYDYLPRIIRLEKEVRTLRARRR